MNITKDIIYDLFPLYATNECSPDTRALVDDYLSEHPREAEELRRIMNTALPRAAAPVSLAEMESLRKARRFVRWQSWLMGLGIFFSLLPFSVIHTHGHTHWLLLDSPVTAIVAGILGLTFWILYATLRRRSRAL